MNQNELKRKLVAIETRKIVDELTWDDIEQGMAILTDQEKDLIAKNIVKNKSLIQKLIDRKLNELISGKATQRVDAYISAGHVELADIARLIE